MGSKQYISIIRLFEHGNIVYTGDINLSRIKKQLLAEFSLATSGIIEIDHFSYNKNDILTAVDADNFNKLLPIHIAIWQNKTLLNFLELTALDIESIEDTFEQFKTDAAFKECCSLKIAVAFNYYTRNFLTVPDLEELGNLMFLNDFIAVEYRETAYHSLRLFLDEQIRLLRNTTAGSYKLMKPKIKHWGSYKRWYKCINGLPVEFYQHRSNLVNGLINLTVALHGRYPQTCYRISRQLMKVKDLSSDTVQLIKSNHKTYRASADVLIEYAILESPRALKYFKKLFSILTKKIKASNFGQ